MTEQEPSIEDITTIIEKLKVLKNEISSNRSKNQTPNEKIFDKIFVDSENENGLSIEELLRAIIKGESVFDLIKESGKIPTREDINNDEAIKNKIKHSSIDELEKALNEVIPKLLEYESISIEGKNQLNGVRYSINEELRDKKVSLKRKEDAKRSMKEFSNLSDTLKQMKGIWPENLRPSINEIDKLFFPWWDYLKANGSWGEDERKKIEAAIKTGNLDEVINELDKIIYKREIYSKRISLNNAVVLQPQEKDNNDAYIPFGKTIELSNGILNRKKLEKAINEGKPVKVRDKKPSKQRRNVHIQDILQLIEKLSSNPKASEEAARMFGEYKNTFQNKKNKQVNLD
jgi:hypothetical protein